MAVLWKSTEKNAGQYHGVAVGESRGSALHLSHVVKAFGAKTVLHGLDFMIARGSL